MTHDLQLAKLNYIFIYNKVSLLYIYIKKIILHKWNSLIYVETNLFEAITVLIKKYEVGMIEMVLGTTLLLLVVLIGIFNIIYL